MLDKFGKCIECGENCSTYNNDIYCDQNPSQMTIRKGCTIRFPKKRVFICKDCWNKATKKGINL